MSTNLEQIHFLSVVTSTPPDEAVTRGQTRSLAVARPVARTLTQSVLHRKDVPVAFLLVERKPNSNHSDVPFEKLVSDAFFRMLNQRSNQLPSLRLMEAVEECDQVVREVFQKNRWREMVREEVTLIGGVFSGGELIIARLGRASALLYRNERKFTLLPERAQNPIAQSSELGLPIPAKIETCALRFQKDDRLLFLGNDASPNEGDQLKTLALLTRDLQSAQTEAEYWSKYKGLPVLLFELENHPAIENTALTESVFKQDVASNRPVHFPGVPPQYCGETNRLAQLPPIVFPDAMLALKPVVGSRPMYYRYRMLQAGLLVWSGDLQQNAQSTSPSKVAIFAVAQGYSSSGIGGEGIARFDGFLGSHIALEFFLNAFLEAGDAEPTLETLRTGFIQTVSDLQTFNLRNGTDVGASLTVALVRKSQIFVAHAGGTGAVLQRRSPENPHTLVLAYPQTIAHLLQTKGIEPPDDFQFDPDRTIFNALTQRGEVEVEVSSWDIQPGDRLVLSTLAPFYFQSDEVISVPSALALGAKFIHDQNFIDQSLYEDVVLIAVDVEEEKTTR